MTGTVAQSVCVLLYSSGIAGFLSLLDSPPEWLTYLAVALLGAGIAVDLSTSSFVFSFRKGIQKQALGATTTGNVTINVNAPNTNISAPISISPITAPIQIQEAPAETVTGMGDRVTITKREGGREAGAESTAAKTESEPES